MFPNPNALFAPALMERLVLVVNHVLSREPQAMARLLPHRGRVLQLDLARLPRLLQPPPLAVAITPAGLVEWCREPGLADLRATLDASNPMAIALQMAGGQLPPLAIEGDAALAADLDWLVKNLRWDVADDLQRLFGPAVAQQLHRLGTALVHALRTAAQAAAGLSAPLRSR